MNNKRSIKRVGKWAKITTMIGQLSYEMEQARGLSLKRFGLKVEGLAKGHISKQDLGWVPLKPSTIANKIRKGYSENILVMTSTYFQSITSFVQDDTVYIGVSKGALHPLGGKLGDIARVHELGSVSGKIPARPLWRPSFQEGIIWHNNKNLPVKIFADRIAKYYR